MFRTQEGARLQAVRLAFRSFLMPMKSRPTPLTESVLHSTGAYELVFSALLCGLLGYGFDAWLGTGPYLMIVFGVFGFIGASASLFFRYRNLLQVMAEENS